MRFCVHIFRHIKPYDTESTFLSAIHVLSSEKKFELNITTLHVAINIVHDPKMIRCWANVVLGYFFTAAGCNKYCANENWKAQSTLHQNPNQNLHHSSFIIIGLIITIISLKPKELVPFTQLVKVRRGKLVLALPSIRFSWNFYQIISGTKYE